MAMKPWLLCLTAALSIVAAVADGLDGDRYCMLQHKVDQAGTSAKIAMQGEGSCVANEDKYPGYSSSGGGKDNKGCGTFKDKKDCQKEALEESVYIQTPDGDQVFSPDVCKWIDHSASFSTEASVELDQVTQQDVGGCSATLPGSITWSQKYTVSPGSTIEQQITMKKSISMEQFHKGVREASQKTSSSLGMDIPLKIASLKIGTKSASTLDSTLEASLRAGETVSREETVKITIAPKGTHKESLWVKTLSFAGVEWDLTREVSKHPSEPLNQKVAVTATFGCPSILRQGETLYQGAYLHAHGDRGDFYLVMQEDGNLVWYWSDTDFRNRRNGRAIAQDQTWQKGRPPYQAKIEKGKLQIFDGGDNSLWSSPNSGYAEYLILQGEGNLVLKSGLQVLWAADTRQE